MSGTADHPPCPKCDPSILPDCFDPVTSEAIAERPGGEMVLVAGAVLVTVDGVDVTDGAIEVDAEHGAVVAVHGTEATDGKITYHLCNRAGLDPFDSRLSADNGGHICHRLLTGEVRILDTATGVAPVLVKTG